MRVAFTVVCLLAFVGVAAAGANADIGIRSVKPKLASPGERAQLSVGGYLGPRPWRPMPIVIVSAALAPRPYPCRGGLCSPRLRPRQLREWPYHLLGQVDRWRARRPGEESGDATFTFLVPKLQPGRYVFGLFCEACVAGPRGSLIIDYRLAMSVLS